MFQNSGKANIASGPSKGKMCHFPFEYLGVKHSKCITQGSPGMPWCSSTPNFTKDTFGYCDCPYLGMASNVL